MKPRDYVVAGQILSARRHGIRLGGPYRYSKAPEERERGEKAWVFELEDNLLEPLTDDARQAFEQADGCELRADSFGEGNMYALHSSSAAGCNLFHRWHRSGQIVPIVKALGIPTIGAEALTFEEKCEIDPHRSRPPKIAS